MGHPEVVVGAGRDLRSAAEETGRDRDLLARGVACEEHFRPVQLGG
jgi:hypothetical protein